LRIKENGQAGMGAAIRGGQNAGNLSELHNLIKQSMQRVISGCGGRVAIFSAKFSGD